MKKILICIIASLVALAANARTFFESCEDIEGITTVYLSKTMIALGGELDVDNGIDLNSIASKVDGLWIVTAEGKKAPIVSSKLKASLTGNKYEKIMSVRDGAETVDILMTPEGAPKTECIIYAREASETTVVILSGTFTLADILAAVKKGR